MASDLDFPAQLADRLTTKRLPRTASYLMVTAGLTTATLLILAAGNTDAPATMSRKAALQDSTDHSGTARDSAYSAAVSALRGTIDLAASRTEQDAHLN